MADERKLNRRQFIGAAGAAAGAAALSSLGPLAPAALAGERLIPDGRLGTILFTQRDAISRDPTTSDLPSGFREVLEFLAGIGFKQIEFAGYRQHANAEGGANLENVAGATLLRQWLDDNELVANGNHGFIPGSWPLTQADLDRSRACSSSPTSWAWPTWAPAATRPAAPTRPIGMSRPRSGAPSGRSPRPRASSCTPTTTTPPTTSCSTAPRWTTSAGRPARRGIRRLEYFFGISDPSTFAVSGA
jgi:hypothetical protein